jgi:poly-gamma-glutamate capsule biosynthesis protein CapA/YwtB (metallophosphatase superfamily)/spermidine synthase/predicted TIM-barrel fold metal-dependent hydrolase
MLICSAVIMMTETVFFHVLTYIDCYLQATGVISVALLGISAGGFGGYVLSKKGWRWLLPFSALAAGIGIALCIPNFLFFPQYLKYPVILVTPFFFLAVIVTHLFTQLRENEACFWSLLGAAAGVLAVCVSVPLMKSENVILTCIAFCGAAGLILSFEGEIKRVPMALNTALLLCSIVLVLGNLFANFFDFGLHTACKHEKGDIHKVFCSTQKGVELMYSRDSLVARVDVLKKSYDGGKTITPTVYQEGVVSDIVEHRNTKTYGKDVRLPAPLTTGRRILIIGTAGEGITKAAKYRSPGKVSGVEINPGIVDLMKNELFDYSMKAYEGIDTAVMDARTYLSKSQEKYDVITLMNAHTRGRIDENAGVPQYLFTQESFKLMFDHLTDQGALILEEVIQDQDKEHFVLKIFASAIEALRREGVNDHFERYFYAYDMRPTFFMFCIKKNPFTEKEAKALDDWFAKLRAADKKNRPGRLIKKVDPFAPMDTNFSRFVFAPDAEIAKTLVETGKDLNAITDDRPFLYDMKVSHPEIWKLFYITLAMTLLLVFLPVLISGRGAFLGQWLFGLGGVGYFGLIGVAYMLVEIVLMQKYQLFLGSPIYSVVVVLTSILAFSSLGGLASGRLSYVTRFSCCVAVPILLLGYAWGVDPLFAATQSLSLPGRVFVAMASLFPLFFCMGTPFPIGLSLVRNRMPEASMALMYGVNGAFCTLGAVISVLLSVYFGFSLSLFAGIGLYFLALAIVACMAGSVVSRHFRIALTIVCALGIIWAGIGVGTRLAKASSDSVSSIAPRENNANEGQPAQAGELNDSGQPDPGEEDDDAAQAAPGENDAAAAKSTPEKNVSETPIQPLSEEEMRGYEKINARESVKGEAELAKLRQVNATFNVKRTILVGNSPLAFQDDEKKNEAFSDFSNNDFVLDAANKYPAEFSALATVDPSDPKVMDKIADYVRRGAIGVQVYDWQFEKGMDHPDYDEFFRFLEMNDIALSIRANVGSLGMFRSLDNVLNAHEFLRIVTPSCMGAESDPGVMEYLLRKHDNLFFDISYGTKGARKESFSKISSKCAELRTLLAAFPTRMFWGSDVVVSDETWKTPEFLRASFADYVSVLERDRFAFSTTGEPLNGFKLDAEALNRFYSENAKNFFRKPGNMDKLKTVFLTRPPAVSDGPALTAHAALIAPIANWFVPNEDLSVKEGKFVAPEWVKSVCADSRAKGTPSLESAAIDYIPAEEVLARVQRDRGTLGFVFLNDLNSKVKLLKVDGVSLLERRLRQNLAKLQDYPFALAVEKGSVAPDELFDPYRYVSVLLTGRSLIGRGMKQRYEYIPPDKLASGIRETLRDADITHLSVETAFVPDDVVENEAFKFCTHMRDFSLLPYLGVDIVSLTGNHSADFGSERFSETLDLYTKYNIAYYGGGRNDSFDETTEVVNRFGARFGFAGYNDISGGEYLSGARHPGARDMRLPVVAKEVRTLASKSDAIIVDFQGGPEFELAPSYLMRQFSDACVQAGADVVNCVHSHVMKGIEYMGDVPCVYGSGNFLFFHQCDFGDAGHSFITKYYFDHEKILQIEVTPIAIANDHLEIGDKAALMNQLEELSEMVNTKSASFTVSAPLFDVSEIETRSSMRLREHFNLTPAPALPWKLVTPEEAETQNATPGQPLAIRSASALLGGAVKALERDNVYILFSFDDLVELVAFRDDVLKDPEKAHDVFEHYADKIIFGGNVFPFKDCEKKNSKQFSQFRLLMAYRNLLEQDSFNWPDFYYCGREWGYDFRKEIPAAGLNLSDGALKKIYSENLVRLCEKAKTAPSGA